MDSLELPALILSDVLAFLPNLAAPRRYAPGKLAAVTAANASKGLREQMNSWITIVWTAISSTCLMLAVMHLAVWCKRPAARSSLLFAILAASTACMAFIEHWMMHAATPEDYGRALRLLHLPLFGLLVSLVLLVRVHLRAGRPWLMWLIIALRLFALGLNFILEPNLNYQTITALRPFNFLGDQIVVAEGVESLWMLVGQLSQVLLIAYAFDASLTVLRRGDRRRAILFGLSVAFFVLAGSVQAISILWELYATPLTLSLFSLGIVAVMGIELSNDVLHAAHLANELRVSEQRVVLAVEGGGAGLWLLDLRRECFWTSDKVRELFGLPQGDTLALTAFMERVHPDDRALIQSALDQVIHSRERVMVEYRVLHPTLGWRWMASRGSVQADASGAPQAVNGTTIDITDRKLAEALLHASEEKYRRLFSEMTSGFALFELITDAEGKAQDMRALAANAACTRLLDLPATALDGQLASACLQPGEWQQCLEIAGPVAQVGVSTRYELHSPRTGRHYAGIAYRPEPGTCAMVFDDISERKALEEQVRTTLGEVQLLRERLELENVYLREQIGGEDSAGAIVGRSTAIQIVIGQIRQVAPTDTHVLITGETGTGKELVAQAIHQMSQRKDRMLVKVNCATLPSTLIESELFGREKGAYTGALTRQIGRFELADKGTIFLDEIGEMTLELQAKLLRVLQEGEFERLGAPRTIRVNARIIAATNRNLAEAVREGIFRKDLYYRLCVFPIDVPPLRERADDIPLLAWAFIDEFSQKMGRKIDTVAQRTMDQLQAYPWPGNVRELRNTIERAFIVSPGSRLEVQLPELKQVTRTPLVTMDEAERRHIVEALQQSGGQIKGPQGAAEKLGMKPSTLYSRMLKLGIARGGSEADIST